MLKIFRSEEEAVVEEEEGEEREEGVLLECIEGARDALAPETTIDAIFNNCFEAGAERSSFEESGNSL